MLQVTRQFKTEPYAHQRKYLEEHGGAYAFFLSTEQGTGKSWMLINEAAILWDKGLIDAVCVLAPNGVHTNWVLNEIPDHLPDWAPRTAVAWDSAMGKKATARFNRVYETHGPRQLRFLTMNWEGLNAARSFQVLVKFFQLFAGRIMFVGDEPSGAIKNPTSTRYKQLLKLKPMTAFRRMADGTPITQGPFDAFAPYHFLDKRILKTDSYMAFKAEYAEMIPAKMQGYDDNGQPALVDNPLIKKIMERSGSKRVPQIVAKGPGGLPKYRNIEKLQRLIAPHTYRVLKKDCLDLPEKVYKTVYFELTKEQREVYDRLKRECRIVYEGEETPVAKLAAITKLAQVTSGFVIHPEHDDALPIPGPNPKIELLMERVQSIVAQGSKVIVWARFHAEIEAIAERLRAAAITFVEYHGGVKNKDREAAKIAFQGGDSGQRAEDGSDPGSGWAQVMVAQQQAGGTGNTWTVADYTIYFSNTFSLRERLQSEDRNHRIGQDKNVVYIDLVALNTIDQKIVHALKAKKNIADIINGDGRALLSDDPDELPF